ncbi:MAG TPA: glycosyltransferase, partial [Vicinamibacterales bacterium]
MPPVVSVAMCVHNGSRYIVETLESVFDQTFQDFEIVIIDDGSTDGTVDLVERHFPDPRIRIIRQRQQTLRVARPAAVANCSGEFIAFLDHDDVWLPHKLETQVAGARTNSAASLWISDCLLIDEQSRTVGRLSDQFDFSSIDLAHPHGHLELLRRGNFVAYPTAFVRREDVRAIGGFDTRFQYVSDYDLWLRLTRRGSIECSLDPLAKYRVHPTQFTQRHSDVTLAEHTQLLWPIIRTASYPKDVRESLKHMMFG